MSVDRDYGSKYIDFTPTPGVSRFCLMERGVLVKDAGVDKSDSGSSSMILQHRTESRAHFDNLVAAAGSASGRVIVGAQENADGLYAGTFADPDGFLWSVTQDALVH